MEFYIGYAQVKAHMELVYFIVRMMELRFHAPAVYGSMAAMRRLALHGRILTKQETVTNLRKMAQPNENLNNESCILYITYHLITLFSVVSPSFFPTLLPSLSPLPSSKGPVYQHVLKATRGSYTLLVPFLRDSPKRNARLLTQFIRAIQQFSKKAPKKMLAFTMLSRGTAR